MPTFGHPTLNRLLRRLYLKKNFFYVFPINNSKLHTWYMFNFKSCAPSFEGYLLSAFIVYRKNFSKNWGNLFFWKLKYPGIATQIRTFLPKFEVMLNKGNAILISKVNIFLFQDIFSFSVIFFWRSGAIFYMSDKYIRGGKILLHIWFLIMQWQLIVLW